MLNRAILMGRLGADPELRTTPSGISVTSFRIAVNRTYDREITDWIDIVAWRKTAEFVCKYFHKGDPIIVEGAIQTRSYEDKNGYKRTAVEVVASQLYFAGSKTENPGQQPPIPPPGNAPSEPNKAGKKEDRPKDWPAFQTGMDVDPDEYEALDTRDEDLPF